ncbi:restriction endonuclease subunit S [Pseudoalteromonas agarivorans]|uniref:restriction endonuclease subunit S n=1 Tax=Pseudoalteromonas agarivorans TaxID=176102 RepID=UPI00211932D2|nr:restriction endonuclease subunit S [Pseudoalteromonas agarivorans]MCQ8884729.1 restriction endonuclease subunit S [Pseudoalteromonas agarivorans]
MSELKAGKYLAYPEYKDSGVEWLGKVPEHWEVKRISYFALLKSGDSIVSEQIEVEGDYPVYGGNGHRGYTNRFNHDGRFILIGRQGALCGNINYGYGKFWASEHAVVVHPTLDVNIKWLGDTLRAMDLNQYNVSAAQPGLAVANITCLKAPFPKIDEQKSIANFLDHETAKIDTLIEKQQQLIKLLKEKRQAVISHAVTKGLNPQAPMKDSGVEWLGEVPAHWIASTLKHYSEVIDCKHITAEFFDDGIPLASISEVKKWFVDLSTAKYTSEKYYNELIGGGREPKVGDIIYSRNATVGEAAIVSEELPPFAMGQDVCLIRLSNGLLPLFAMYVLHSGVISQQLELAMVGSTFKRINVDNIRNFAFVIPPLSEQDLIVSELEALTSKYDVLINNATNAIELMKERGTALISAAVTGKIDVRNWRQPND